ncbi:hypothetical protein CPB85DRAFT_1441524 [Mucidula mucida]|nr:hypothetical protein CPB85DRAFT_1441524 [Mucidula mucida]
MDISSKNDVHVNLVRFLLSKIPFPPKAPSQWQFTSTESRLDESLARLHRQYATLERMKDVWRRDILEVPHTWLLTDLHATEVEGNIATMNLGFSVSHCTVSRLSTDAVIDRHNKADCVAPDFCLTKQRSGLHYAYFHTLGVKLNPPKRLEDMYQHCTQTASDVMMYGHEEVLASFSVQGYSSVSLVAR